MNTFRYLNEIILSTALKYKSQHLKSNLLNYQSTPQILVLSPVRKTAMLDQTNTKTGCSMLLRRSVN